MQYEKGNQSDAGCFFIFFMTVVIYYDNKWVLIVDLYIRINQSLSVWLSVCLSVYISIYR